MVRVLGLALDCLRRTGHTRAGRRLGADCGSGALHIGAARARAGRALTTLTLASAAINNNRLRLGYAGLENIIAQLRYRRALRFQHVLTHIRARGCRRN